MAEWTKEQREQYREIVDISHKLARNGAEKLLQDINEWPCESFLKFLNIEERMGEAIRRGAIEVLSLQAHGKKEWEKNFQERF